MSSTGWIAAHRKEGRLEPASGLLPPSDSTQPHAPQVFISEQLLLPRSYSSAREHPSFRLGFLSSHPLPWSPAVALGTLAWYCSHQSELSWQVIYTKP